MTGRASEVLRTALTDQARTRERRAAVYLNVRPRSRARSGRWLSEVGFLADLPFAYAVLDPANALPDDGNEGRAVDRILLVPYGLQRDLLRLEGASPADRAVRTTRRAGAPGLAPYPGDETYLAPADFADDTSVVEKTAGLLAAMRTAGGSPGYHVVVTRSGAIYVAAPLDERVAPVPESDSAVCVAVECAARKGRGAGDRPEIAPFPDAQLVSLAVLFAKLGSAYLGLDLTVGNGIRYVPRADEPLAVAQPSPLLAGSPLAVDLARRVEAEGLYDVASEVFRRDPPAAASRAEAQTALGTEDTLGATTLLLGAYADVAAADRSDGMQEVSRRRVFVERARVSHQEAGADAEAAGTAANAERLAPVLPVVEGTGPHVYDYRTGLWGDESPG